MSEKKPSMVLFPKVSTFRNEEQDVIERHKLKAKIAVILFIA